MNERAMDDKVQYLDDTYLVIHQAESGFVVKVCAHHGPARLHAFATINDVVAFVSRHKFKVDRDESV